jgi:hypothetical protein
MAVRKKTEFFIDCPHKPGELARALETLAKAEVNILAFCGYGHGDTASMHFVVDEDAAATAALKAARIEFDTHRVVAVTAGSGPGQGAKFARALADAKINIEYAYASTSGTGDSTAVFGVKNVERALQVLG